jgi:hypothetical protein
MTKNTRYFTWFLFFNERFVEFLSAGQMDGQERRLVIRSDPVGDSYLGEVPTLREFYQPACDRQSCAYPANWGTKGITTNGFYFDRGL